MPSTPEYERNRLARIKRNMAQGAAPLAEIKRISAELVYSSAAHDKQRRKGEDGGSGSEYEPNDDEADDADEVSGEEEEQETTIHVSKAKGKQASTKPQGRKRARSKTTVPTTTRTTRASACRLNQTEQTPPDDNNASPHHASNDHSNSPQADTDMQHSQDLTDTSRQIENTVTVRSHGQGALLCCGTTNPNTSMRVKRRPTMGHGLDIYARRNGGMKMKINFSAGRVRPLDPVEAANLASQCGIHVRSNIMRVATHWNDYSKQGLNHHIPKAIDHVVKNFEMDPKEVSKGVCTKILQKGVRQRRYILKRDYFTGRTVQEALSNKPPNVSQQNWEALVNKWSDERNKEISEKNKRNREAVKHHQTTGSRSYPAHFHQLKKEKYNNEDPSPIEFFKETHTNRKTGCMSTAALDAYNAMETKRNEAQPENEQPVPDTQIVAEVLKEHSSSSTFLSTMGYQSRSGRSRTSASVERVRELEERVEQQNREAIEAKEMYQQDAIERVKAQDAALEEMQRKQKEELAALKKSQEEKNKAYEKKQEERDNLISFLLRQHATKN